MARRKYTAFGFGVTLCAILAVALAYGVYVAYAQENRQEPPDRPLEQESFTLDVKGHARFVNIMGEETGMAQLEESANGVLIRAEVHGLPSGLHAMHIHEYGNCTPVNEDASEATSHFKNAGSHLNPNDKEHGLLNPGGPHAGDMVNVHVHDDGTLKTQVFNDRITMVENEDRQELAYLFDPDGSALVIHSGSDDYKTSPTGNAGDRIACAIIEKD